MEFSLPKSIEILERTPRVLRLLLIGLDENWIMNNEGADTWSPYDVVGHLLHGEKTDWIVRARIILSEGTEKSFKPFDRFAQFNESKGKSLEDILNEFEDVRTQNIATIKSFALEHDDLQKTGIHPHFGVVTLQQLLATWTAHDLGHIVQIARIMGRQYRAEVGPWAEYLSIMHQPSS